MKLLKDPGSRTVKISFFVILLTVLVVTGCGGGGGTTSLSSVGNNSNPATGNAVASHVFVVVLENQNYKTVIGSASMPYLNSLALQGGLATNYFANVHPSLPDYLMMTVGSIVTTNDSFKGIVSDDNIVRQITNSGMTWKAYAQSLPSVGYLGADVYPYSHHHVPFTYFSDVQDSSAQQLNVVPLTQLTTDLASNSLPNYAMIVPDQRHNAHDCPTGLPTASACTPLERIAAADDFLKATVEPLLSNPTFQQSGLLIVTFDEAAGDKTNGGGKVATVLVGSHVRPGYQSTTFYQHQSLLRLSLEALGLKTFPGAAAKAPSMTEFFD
jgi:phosphatidylinositol-3-phosphatase